MFEFGRYFGALEKDQSVAPAAQATTAAWADVAGSTLDTLHQKCVSFTIINTGANSLDWKVLASNDAAFTVAVEVKASAAVLAGASDSYSATVAVWRYYKVQVQDTAAPNHGEATVHGVAKG
jgi:hypothetical protein